MTGLEIQNMLVDHFIGNVPEGCIKPVVYVMQGNGLWEIRRNKLGVFHRQIAEAEIPGLPSTLKEGFELSVPKIPISVLWQAVSFFRKVYELHQSEAIIRVAYDNKLKKYSVDCPPQKVSAAHCGFDKPKLDNSKTLVAEIHSHGSLAASFSGTDDKDELADRFFGIVGKVNDFFPQTCFRVSIGGTRLSIDIDDLFDVEADPMMRAKFPAGWLDQVKKQEFPKPKKLGHAPRRFLEDRGSPERFLEDPDDPENFEEDMDEYLFGRQGWNYLWREMDGEEE